MSHDHVITLNELNDDVTTMTMFYDIQIKFTQQLQTHEQSQRHVENICQLQQQQFNQIKSEQVVFRKALIWWKNRFKPRANCKQTYTQATTTKTNG